MFLTSNDRDQVPARRVARALDLPPEAIMAVCALIPCQTLEVREYRRLRILYESCFLNLSQTAKVLGHTQRTVKRWRNRAQQLIKHLADLPRRPSHEEMKSLLLATVKDAPRPGAPSTYTAEQQCAIIALAVRKPCELGVPIQTWTHRELAAVAHREKIAAGISRRTVGRILQFVEYFNATMARAFKWTYRGKALQA